MRGAVAEVGQHRVPVVHRHPGVLVGVERLTVTHVVAVGHEVEPLTRLRVRSYRNQPERRAGWVRDRSQADALEESLLIKGPVLGRLGARASDADGGAASWRRMRASEQMKQLV